MNKLQGKHKDTRDVARGAAVNFLGILARSLSFVFYVVLARLYGDEHTGLYLLAWATVDVGSKLTILGLDRGVLARVAMRRADGDGDGVYQIVGQALAMGFVFSLAMIALSQVMASTICIGIYQEPQMITPLRVMVIGMLPWTLSAILLFATRALRVMRYEIYTKSVIEPVVLLAGALFFYYLGWGALGLALAFLLSTSIGAGMAVVFYCRELSLGRTLFSMFQKKGAGELLRFAAPIGIYDMLNLLLQRVDIFMVGRYLSTSMAGVYGIAVEVAFALKKVRQSFDPIVIPVISAAHQQGDRSRVLEQYRNVTRWILAIDGALLGVILLAGDSLLRIFGTSFTAGYGALAFLALSIVINGVLGVSELFILIDRPVINVFNSVGALVVNVALNLLLIPQFGLTGAAIAITVAYALMNGARLIEVAVLYKIHPFTRRHGLSLLAAVFASGWAFGFSSLFTGGLMSEVFASVFFLGLYLLSLDVLGAAPEIRKVWLKICSAF